MRREAIAELRTRMATILVAGGFHTDAGQLVFVNETPVLGENDPEAAVAIVIGEDQVIFQAENVVTRLPVEIQALAKATLADAWSTVEDVLDDIKKAAETDFNLAGKVIANGFERGSTRTLEREQGSTTVGVGLTYALVVREKWGVPA